MADVLTLHALDSSLSIGLSEYARREQKSLNQSAKELLSVALGLTRRKSVTDHNADLDAFFGCLDDETWKKAKKALAEFDKVDAEAWK